MSTKGQQSVQGALASRTNVAKTQLSKDSVHRLPGHTPLPPSDLSCPLRSKRGLSGMRLQHPRSLQAVHGQEESPVLKHE